MKELKGQVLSSMQLHPLFAALNNSSSSSLTTSNHNNNSSNSVSLGQNSNLSIIATSSSSATAVSTNNSTSILAGPNGSILPSGLSVTITPASSSSNHHSHHHNNNNIINHNNNKTSAKFDSPANSPMSPTTSINSASALSPSATAAAAVSNLQAQQLRALASGLTASLAAAQLNLNNSSSSSGSGSGGGGSSASNSAASAAVLNQASLITAASKLMEINPVDDLVMQEVTQRLFKMNQEIWQQAAVVANNNAGGNNSNNAGSNSGGGGQSHNSSTSSSPSPSNSRHQQEQQQQQQQQQQQSQQHHVNEIKLAEKLVNELALQIFMHKSAMQLQQQQQQQQQASAQQVQNHHNLVNNGGSGGGGGNIGNGGINGVSHGSGGGGHMRAASVSSNVSENGGVGKPHQCHQCMKAFSSNHQLVQHVRVHTGEKPYKCSYCERRFKQLSHVQQHTRLHTGERPYKCHVHECGRAFIQLSNLQQHLRNHDAQLERSKNRPFHCNICGKGFATESSLRTHTAKVCKEQHAALIGGPNTVSCPVCHKLFLGGEALMEHMKHTHKDPNASGVATKRRTANHPCPVCGKHYVNEGSLRKHMTCHPETAQLTTSLRMWPCSVCQAVFTHEAGLLTHMEQMRMDPKHQFAAQYVLSRAAAERRERENILTAAAVAAMAGGHSFPGGPQGQSLNPLLPAPSPSGSESSGRLGSPVEANSGVPNHSHHRRHRMSITSPINGPLDARINNNNSASVNNANNNNIGDPSNQSRKEYNTNDKYDMYDKISAHENNNVPIGHNNHQSIHQTNHMMENGPNKFQATEAAMKMAAMLGQNQIGGPHGHGQNDLRNLIHHQQSQLHGQDMMSAQIQAEALLRSQAAEAIRLAVANNMDRSSNGSSGTNPIPNGNSGTSATEVLANHIMTMSQAQHHQQQFQQQDLHRGNSNSVDSRMTNGHNGTSNHHHNMQHHSNALNHQLNSILNQQSDLSEALLRLDARSLGFPLPAHNS